MRSAPCAATPARFAARVAPCVRECRCIRQSLRQSFHPRPSDSDSTPSLFATPVPAMPGKSGTLEHMLHFPLITSTTLGAERPSVWRSFDLKLCNVNDHGAKLPRTCGNSYCMEVARLCSGG